jgi:isopenicillin-N epimerase
VPVAIAFRKQHTWSEVAARCHDLAQETAARVGALTGLAAFSSPAFSAPQMIAMPVTHPDPPALQRELLRDYAIEIPCFNWKHHAIVRLSVQGYNTHKQMDSLVSALSNVLMPKAATI